MEFFNNLLNVVFEPPKNDFSTLLKQAEYSPNGIHVKQGQTVRLLITAMDRKQGFEIKELGIKMELEKGREAAVEFVAAKAGEFEFHCTVFCGFGHGRMKGKLIVEAADAISPGN